MPECHAPDDVRILRDALDGGAELTRRRAMARFGWADRRFRAAVAELRSLGYPVIATSGEGSRYRRARTYGELEDFVDRELVSRSRTIEEQIRRLREGAPRYFNPQQMALIA